MKPRIIFALCLLVLCASPVFAEDIAPAEAAAAEPSAASEPAPEPDSFYEGFEIEQGGCSMSQIREAQNWCHQKASVASVNGRECTSKGIHYCTPDSSGGYNYECDISCK